MHNAHMTRASSNPLGIAHARSLQLRVPRVVGMLGAGLLLANVPGEVVAAFPKRWGVQMRAAALATIFLRCGLELEFKVRAPRGGVGAALRPPGQFRQMCTPGSLPFT